MWKGFRILILICCISVSCKSEKENKLSHTEKEALFTDMDGLPVTLEQFKGKRVLVNFWATWCVPCLKEFPSIEEAQELLLDENYVFLFPSPDSEKKIKAFDKSKGYSFTYLSLNQSLDKLNIYALPTTIIYTTDGGIYKKIDGSIDWSSPEIIKMLRYVP